MYDFRVARFLLTMFYSNFEPLRGGARRCVRLRVCASGAWARSMYLMQSGVDALVRRRETDAGVESVLSALTHI